jgi:hypothetical protein
MANLSFHPLIQTFPNSVRRLFIALLRVGNQRFCAFDGLSIFVGDARLAALVRSAKMLRPTMRPSASSRIAWMYWEDRVFAT